MLYIKDINNNYIGVGDNVIAVINNKLYKGLVLKVCPFKLYIRIELNVADRFIKSEKYHYVYINHYNVLKDNTERNEEM